MSAESLTRIFEAFNRRLDGVERVEDGLSMLREMVEALARDLAESVFLTAQTTRGFTPDGAQCLADEAMHQHGLAITETVHTFGGTLDMALGLVEAAADAYGARLTELCDRYGGGGAA